MAKINTYSKREAAMYLIGLGGQNMIYNIIATGLYYYFQNVICLNAMALGWIMAIARVWDAVNDPMMGTIVDKTKSKWGKCRPYLLFVPPVVMVITIATFLNGNYAVAERAGDTTKMVLITGHPLGYELYHRRYSALGNYSAYDRERGRQSKAHFVGKNFCLNLRRNNGYRYYSYFSGNQRL